MEPIIALCKRRGFLYPSSEIYGGLANTWDFGHYGTLLKNNLRDMWWKKFVLQRSDMVGVDASTILPPRVWEASGHLTGFNDALIDCKNCHFRTRADHLIEDKIDQKVEGLTAQELTNIIKKNKLGCPKCGSKELTDVRKFNLLFETKIGIIDSDKSKAYLRGELAQGIFMNYKNALDTLRVKIPFGIAQQGKVFRNEITMGQGAFRTLEFDLMEFEYFINPKNWEKIFAYWQKEMWQYALDIGLTTERIRWREHAEFERSFYSKKTVDVEYRFPFGFKELWGIAYRTDHDLKNHSLKSGVSLSYKDIKTGEEYIPHVIEPTFGLSRLTMAIIVDSYQEEVVNGKTRVFLKLNSKIAPIKVAVFPLQKDDNLNIYARKIYEEVKLRFTCEFDDAGNIGKMYRRQDEIGTPYCVTIDYETLKDDAVTVRVRDSMKQERVHASKLLEFFGTNLD
ncbi:MAG: Glycine-tRNA ligase [Candidatus Roizmanbacteria bacterium GW2011_GWA2_35_19]|uniref:glycine--tRNA ligase n=2 Tax=Candidatus Roizmaniibacteriota TaxID=1752723 RepID=A0A0G0EGR9_9BACT|nr:MAG: Glycine-tRNA ligase [Candidatus Roizmanbacteria bacterium GW2011_GWC2_35_12]KKP74410.1 MAG: Glycine-tRNA ligase [Candidatus Roizmanbacteria bacterium GW2011_GWA2_35_19]